ncbi:lamin tail domain-containing protein [Patescibacteria group bacterium]
MKTNRNNILPLPLLLPTLALIGSMTFNVALAYYYDTEFSSGNSATAASLDMEVSSPKDGLEKKSHSKNFKINQALERIAVVENIGSLEFQYEIGYQKESGDNDLCKELELEAKKDNNKVFEGNLDEFEHTVSSLDPASSDNWKFEVSLPKDADEELEELDCNFNFEFTAWQTNFPSYIQGWVDKEVLEGNEIHTGDWMGPKVTKKPTVSDPINTRGDKNDIQVEVSWHTNENSTTNLVYDTESHTDVSSYHFSHPTSSDTTADLKKHSTILTGLEMSTKYYFRILTKDQHGNERISDEYFFEISDPKPSLPGSIVMNEFVPNPTGGENAMMPDGEWVELFNNTGFDVNVAGWYLTDLSGKKLYIYASNCDNNKNTSDSGETIVPAGGYLVVYDNKASFSLNNNGDTIALFNNNYTPNKFSDDIQMDIVAYGKAPQGKTFARFPDGIGPWIDPDGTPGKKNKLSKKEIEDLQEYTFEVCFGGKKLDLVTTDPLCNPHFLVYIEMLKDPNSRKLRQKRFLKEEESKSSKKPDPLPEPVIEVIELITPPEEEVTEPESSPDPEENDSDERTEITPEEPETEESENEDPKPSPEIS